jgi:hypothetical protein
MIEDFSSVLESLNTENRNLIMSLGDTTIAMMG